MAMLLVSRQCPLRYVSLLCSSRRDGGLGREIVDFRSSMLGRYGKGERRREGRWRGRRRGVGSVCVCVGGALYQFPVCFTTYRTSLNAASSQQKQGGGEEASFDLGISSPKSRHHQSSKRRNYNFYGKKHLI